MTLSAKEKRVRAKVWKPYAKKIADDHCIEEDWTTDSTFHAAGVSELIRQVILSLTPHEYEFEGKKITKHFDQWKPEGRLQMVAIWQEIADNLQFGLRSEG